jgi:hypothetical protein
VKSATPARVLLAVLLGVLLMQNPLFGPEVASAEAIHPTADKPLPQRAAAARPAAQAGPMPDVGPVRLEDPLTAPGLLRAGRCPTGRNLGEFVGDGYILKVTGKCSENDPVAIAAPSPFQGLTFSDGEVRLEARAVSGHDRVAFVLGVRGQTPAAGSYQATIMPGRGVASLTTGTSEVAMRTGLGGRLAPDGWNSLAVRAQGPNLWVLLNDEPILTTTDPAYQSGSVFIGVRRLGDANDSPESAVVVRNLRVSSLAE